MKIQQKVEAALDAACAGLIAAQEHFAEKESEAMLAKAGMQTAEDSVQRLRNALAALKGRAEEATPVQPEKTAPAPQPDNPYAGVRCAGCGETGLMTETITERNGKTLRMVVCGGCGNQQI